MDDAKAIVGTHEEIMSQCPQYRKLYETVSTQTGDGVAEHTENVINKNADEDNYAINNNSSSKEKDVLQKNIMSSHKDMSQNTMEEKDVSQNKNTEKNKKNNGSKNSHNVGSIILHTIIKKKGLSLGIIVSVCGTIITALYPPLVLG